MLRNASPGVFEATCDACQVSLTIPTQFESTASLRLVREAWHVESDGATWCPDCQPTRVSGHPSAMGAARPRAKGDEEP